MTIYNLTGRRRRHDTVPLLAEKLRVNVFLLQFSSSIRFFVNVLIEMNVSISNELNFSDVYRSVNYIIGSPAKFTSHATESRHFVLKTMLSVRHG